MKRIGTTLYVHKSNLSAMLSILDESVAELILKLRDLLPNDFSFDIVKYDKKSFKVSFISSPDWDTSREPLVGDSLCTNIYEPQFKLIKSKGQIYHHKWMFVSSDYSGFNVEDSKVWSNTWESILPKERSLKSRIGYKKYWEETLKKYNLPLC